ncbi:MAG: CpsD/CapB family tyrosine-protein kinase [Clostridia bacterium]|nr:CpsD/CapB family tyrosine-protein kinase [Clostridia bacterium]
MAKQIVSLSDRELTESAKTLRSNIDFAGIDTPIRSITITSPEKGDGKTIIACALAMAEALADRKTLLIDNDFRNPQIAPRMHVRGSHRLGEVLNAKVENFMDFCLETKTPNLYVLDVGTRRSDPVEVLSSRKYARLMSTAMQVFDFIVVDTPPLGMFIDAALVAPKTDGVVVVIRSGKDTPESVRSTLSQIEKSNARVIGAVLNGAKRKHSDYYYYYYSSKDHKTKRKSTRRKE